MLKFVEVYGIEKQGKIEEINMDNFLKLNVEVLDSNLRRIDTIVEQNYTNLSVAEKYKMKVKLTKLIATLTQKFSGNDTNSFYYDVVNATLLTLEDIKHGMKVIGEDNRSMIDWNLIQEEVKVK